MNIEEWIIQTKIRPLTRTDFRLAPLVGLEPTTCGLTVRRSTDWAKEECLCWHYLSSRAVARQVLSAQMCLTSVFGMGTGGPTSQSIPTHMDGFEPSLIVKSLAAWNSIRIIAPSNAPVKNKFVLFPAQQTSEAFASGSDEQWHCLCHAARSWWPVPDSNRC